MQADFFPYEGGSGGLIDKFEDMLNQKRIGYFDVEDFEVIIDYYLIHLKLKKALIVVEESLRQHPGSDLLLLWKARVFFKMAKYNTSLRVIDSISDKDFDEDVLMLKGEILLRLERFSTADLTFRRIVDNATDGKDNVCLDIAFIYLENQKIEVAVQYMQRGLDFNPKNIDILFELAFFSESKEQAEKAIMYYNKIIDIDPFSSDAWFNLGLSHLYFGQYTEAITAFDFTLTINDKFYNAILQKGVAYMRMNEFEKALEVFQEYVKTGENNENAYLSIAECKEEMGNYAEAEKIYYDILEYAPDVYDAWIGLGYCKQAQELHDESIGFFKKALGIDKNSVEAWNGLADSYLSLSMKELAMSSYEKSLDIDPTQDEVWLFYAGLIMDKGDYALTLEILEKGMSFVAYDNNLKILHNLVMLIWSESGKTTCGLNLEEVLNGGYFDDSELEGMLTLRNLFERILHSN
jgi:tetratricopeptide (TPR) repeat protein